MFKFNWYAKITVYFYSVTKTNFSSITVVLAMLLNQNLLKSYRVCLTHTFVLGNIPEHCLLPCNCMTKPNVKRSSISAMIRKYLNNCHGC